MVSLNKNYLTILNQQDKSATRLNQAIERLSSGLRINSAKDDAAGQAIANRMTANLNANSVITNGMKDGLSLMQTAESGLNAINNLIQRGRQLAVQAANGTLSDSDQTSLNGEYQQIREEIDRIASSTQIFGRYPLAPTEPGPQPVKLGNTLPLAEKFPDANTQYQFPSGVVSLAYIPAGAKNITITIDSLGADDDIQLFARDGKHLAGTPTEGADADIVWSKNGVTDESAMNTTVITQNNGFLPGATYSADSLLQAGEYNINAGAQTTYQGMTITYSGDGDRFEDANTGGFNDGNVGAANQLEKIHIDEVTEDLIVIVVGSGVFYSNASWDELPTPTEPAPPLPPSVPISKETTFVVGASFGDTLQTVTLSPTPADSQSLGLSSVTLGTPEQARAALATFDNALKKLDGYRSEYGSQMNHFESITAVLSQEKVATATARSHILDADYALEVSAMTKAQILQQASMAVLSQANQQSGNVLKLLQG
ncbi:flagellin [Pectobacterium brasiliense]|uniref:flagellin N-terminal helical domain-containing protein n=1 Tax=Pectobacterium brasiliense TaxID=180957 RepID=UPI001968C1FE|nr:flagellin [Pectobacterium brasiliense]MBN3189526.1 flagellin [Pectobacterium brasiliense]